MRTTHILALSLLPACGPIAPPLESATTTEASTTTGASTSTTADPAPTTAPTTTAANGSTTSIDTAADTTAQDRSQLVDPCEFANSCDKGLVCLNTASASSACQQGSSGCCQPFCKYPGAPCPNPDQQCVQWFDPMMPIPPGYEEIGICAIPE